MAGKKKQLRFELILKKKMYKGQVLTGYLAGYLAEKLSRKPIAGGKKC
jgi:hypothetical protein